MTAQLLLALALAIQAPVRAGAPSAPGTVTGRIATPTGAPASGIRVGALEATQSGAEPSLAGITQTKADGSYELQGLPPGRYFIFAGPLQLPSYFPGETERDKATVVTVTGGETRRGVDFSVAQTTLGFKLSGRMVWHGTQRQPREGIMLALLQPDGAGIAGVALLKTDATFEIANILPGHYVLLTSLDGPGGTDPIAVEVRDQDIDNLEVVLPRMVKVAFLVLTEGGETLPSFKLWLIRSATGHPGAPVQIAPGVLEAMVADGEYHLRTTNLPPGLYVKSIVSGSEDVLRSTLRVPSFDSTVRVTVVVGKGSPVEVSGRVTGTTLPFLTGLELKEATSEFPAFQGSGSNRSNTRPLEAAINADGTFRFSSVMPDSYMAYFVLASGIRVPAGTVHVAERNVTGLEFTGPPMREIIGRISVEGGGPAPRFHLVVFRGGSVPEATETVRLFFGQPLGGVPLFPSVGDAAITILSVTPLPDGTFRFTLPEGQYSLVDLEADLRVYEVKSMTMGGANLQKESLKVTPEGPAELLLKFALNPQAVWSRVAGRVTGLDAVAAGSTRVRLGGGAVVQIETPLSRDGSFDFPKVPPGGYTLQLVPAPKLARETPINIRNANVTGIEIAVPKLHTIRGRAQIEGAGSPGSFTLIFSTVSDGVGTSIFVNPESNGAFEALVPEGRFHLRVAEIPFTAAPKSLKFGTTDIRLETVVEINAAAVAEKRLDIVMSASKHSLRLDGRVTGVDLSGKARIVLNGVGAAIRVTAPIQDGTFSISGLPPNVYHVTVEHDGPPVALDPAFVTVRPGNSATLEFVTVKPSSEPGSRGPNEATSTGVVAQPVLSGIVGVPEGISGLNAREFAAIANLRTINVAEVTYLSSSGGMYGELKDLINAGLLNNRFQNEISGYRFSIIAIKDDYLAVTFPAKPDTGFTFFSSPDGVVRFAADEKLAPSGVAGQPVQ